MRPVSFSVAAQRAPGIETLPKTNVGEAAMTSINLLKPPKRPCNTLPKTLSSRQTFIPPPHPLRALHARAASRHSAVGGPVAQRAIPGHATLRDSTTPLGAGSSAAPPCSSPRHRAAYPRALARLLPA